MQGFDTPETEETSAPEAQGQEQESTEGTETTLNPASDIIDLDSVQKFKFQGREWTPQEMQRAYLMQQDYTKKTQSLSEERKYMENLEHDLARVKSEPNLIGQFMQIYPKKFHRFLELAGVATGSPAPKQSNAPQGMDPEFLRRFETVETAFKQQTVKAIESELDNKFSALQKKYPFADEEVILARAEALLNKGEELSDKVWDDLWKSNHQKMEKSFKEHYSKQVATQKNANKKSADVAPGGGIPGQKPRTPKTIKEASQFALEEIERS